MIIIAIKTPQNPSTKRVSVDNRFTCMCLESFVDIRMYYIKTSKKNKKWLPYGDTFISERLKMPFWHHIQYRPSQCWLFLQWTF